MRMTLSEVAYLLAARLLPVIVGVAVVVVGARWWRAVFLRLLGPPGAQDQWFHSDGLVTVAALVASCVSIFLLLILAAVLWVCGGEFVRAAAAFRLAALHALLRARDGQWGRDPVALDAPHLQQLPVWPSSQPKDPGLDFCAAYGALKIDDLAKEWRTVFNMVRLRWRIRGFGGARPDGGAEGQR